MDASAETRARWLFGALLLLAALAAAAWLLPGLWRHATYEIRTQDSVSGLVVGAPVEFHGVEVGKVRSVELMGSRLVRVLIEVRRDVVVNSATVATITGRGLAARGFTGYVYVSLEDNGSAGGPLAPAADGRYPLLATAPSRQASLDTSFHELNASVQAINTLLQGALDARTLASLKQSLAGLEQVSRTLSDNNEKLVRIIANAERASAQMQPLLATSNEAARTLQAQVLPRADGAIVRLDNLSSLMERRMGVILDNTEQASARIGPLLQSSSEAVLVLQSQILPQTQRTLAHMDQLSASLGETAGRIRRNPSLLLRSTAAVPGPGEAQ